MKYFNILSFISKKISFKSQQYNPKPSEKLIEVTRIGGGDFDAIGKEFFQYFLDLGKLKPNDKVLDVGCGLGRIAIPLTSYLKDRGAYEGFDVFAKSIKWCKKNIGRKYTNFNFQVSDIHNKFYNPKGKYKAAEYKFPYDNYSFDFVFLTSVFTHMRPEEMEHYMSEIARVLKKDGRCLITFFLLNQESLQLMNNGRSRESFTHHFDTYQAVDTEIPEYCIAYHEDFVLNLYKKYHLEILYPIHYGSWCGRDIFMGYQDIIIAVKD